MPTPHRASRLLYRVLLRLYPASFRRRFGHDLETDFVELLTRRGVAAAWGSALSDLTPSMGETHAHARVERRG